MVGNHLTGTDLRALASLAAWLAAVPRRPRSARRSWTRVRGRVLLTLGSRPVASVHMMMPGSCARPLNVLTTNLCPVP